MKCGKNWRETPGEQECAYGILLGDWDKVEKYKLELQLKGDNPGKDWYFYRGNKVWTAWRNWWEAKDVIVVSMLDDLIYWVGQATNNPYWKRDYKQ